jgi:hypothetical protein
VVVRLVFHDAGTYSAAAGDGGLNASIRFELDRPDNFGLKRGWWAPFMQQKQLRLPLRGWLRMWSPVVVTQAATGTASLARACVPATAPVPAPLPHLVGPCRAVIEAADKKLKGTAAEGAVSKADLVALAGAHAVRITGGPAVRVPVGRLDAAGPDPDGRMPQLDFSAEQQLANFAAKGLSPQEFIALSGSHTVRGEGRGGASHVSRYCACTAPPHAAACSLW